MERPDDDADGDTETDADGNGSGGKTQFDPASFVGLVITLATQAQIFLGVIENPVTRKKEELDLPRSKSIVDLLGVLEKKTLGNLTDEEAEFLKRVLADLRMRWVRAQSAKA